jgi:glycosyltransferase involved in cell wall biosynthesis
MNETDRKKGNTAIFYLPNEFSRDGGKLMGRQSAGEAFVKAMARHGEVERYYAFSPSKRAAQVLSNRINAVRGPDNVADVNWIPMQRLDRLREPGGMFTYDPGVAKWAWQRQFVGPAAFSICGITHTTASHSIMDSFGALTTAPVYPWDALICTSACVKSTADNILDGWDAYLSERLGASKRPRPMLPVIPLGVDCDSFTDTPKRAEQRQSFRNKHGIGNDDVVVLFLGRLSFHAKANPYPMYLALEATARKTGKKIHLVQTGWFGTDGIEKAFRDGARDFAPSINAIFADGHSEEERAESWAAADIFSSLADNIQETFGLTPIEAMAAGLPLVVTEWDGYRDTMRPGIDGFAIPTMTPPNGSGQMLAHQHAIDAMNYDHYIGYASMSVTVDIAKATEAYTALVEDPALRKKMGAAGKQRAREIFDWRHIIASYQNLWHEMAKRRQRDGPSVAANPALLGHPSRPDPFTLFDSYPTDRLHDDIELRLGRMDVVPDLTTLRNHRLTNLANATLATEDVCQQFLTSVADNEIVRVGTLVSAMESTNPRDRLYRTIAWLVKMGLLERADVP